MGVEEAVGAPEPLLQEINELEQELQEQVDAVRECREEALNESEEVPVTPRRTDIQGICSRWPGHRTGNSRMRIARGLAP